MAALEKKRFDVVLMDVQMPEMDGLQATRIIRDPQSKVLDHQVPIIALSGNAMKRDQAQCIEAGMDACLTKPIHSEKLYTALKPYITGSGPAEKPLERRPPSKEALVLKKEALLKNLGGDEAFYNELWAMFIEDTLAYFDQIKLAIEIGDMQKVTYYAHTIKGARPIWGPGCCAKQPLKWKLPDRTKTWSWPRSGFRICARPSPP